LAGVALVGLALVGLALACLICRWVTAGHGRRANRCLAGGSGKLAVVDKSHHALGVKRITILVGVDRKVREGITSDGVQDSAGIFGDHLDMPVKKHPITGQRFIAVAQGVPAMMCLCILRIEVIPGEAGFGSTRTSAHLWSGHG